MLQKKKEFIPAIVPELWLDAREFLMLASALADNVGIQIPNLPTSPGKAVVQVDTHHTG